jgi:hypothetical protein
VISFDISEGRLPYWLSDVVAAHVHRPEHVLAAPVAVVRTDAPANRKRATAVLPMMKRYDGGRTPLAGSHFHDADTGASAGLAVSHYRRASHVAMNCEEQCKALVVHRIRQIANFNEVIHFTMLRKKRELDATA